MRTMIERENNTNPCGLGKAGEQILDARRPRVGAPCSRRLRGEAQLGSFSGSGSAAAHRRTPPGNTASAVCPWAPGRVGVGQHRGHGVASGHKLPGFLAARLFELVTKITHERLMSHSWRASICARELCPLPMIVPSTTLY